MTLFREKYRVESARMPHWDYSWPGCYFVTICTKNRTSYFGRIADGSMNLSALGVHAAACWQEIPTHHPRVEIDEFIVMPNHVHGIIVITGPERLPKMRKRGQIGRVQDLSEVHPKSSSLASVVGAFKSAVTNRCRTQSPDFDWQPRFHDRVIRGKNSMQTVREYIRENPANWHKDPFFVA
jgi:REP element-mobilizing transposase RayT